MGDMAIQSTQCAAQAVAAGVSIAVTQTQPNPLVCFQGGPWEDDLHHNVHQRELAPIPTGSFCVPIPL